MIYCSYADLLKTLRDKDVKIVGKEPNCPKQMDSFCMGIAGHCEQGNKRDCEQFCTVETSGGGRYRFQVLFVYHENSRDGYVVKESLSIQNLIERKIISETDLVVLLS